MEHVFGDAELIEVTLLVPMTVNEANYSAGDKVSAPVDVIAAWREAGIVER